MKIIVTITFSIVLSVGFLVYGQTTVYQPFPNGQSASWTVTNGSSGQNVSSVLNWTSDTIINGVSYQKAELNGAYVGGIRQNIVNEEAFFLNTQNQEVDISFNQNSNVGDILYFPSGGDMIYSLNNYRMFFDSLLIVTQLDSVNVQGNYRKQFTLEPAPGQFGAFGYAKYVTGVGFILFAQLNYGHSLICHKINEIPITISGGFSNQCSLNINEIRLLQLEMSPNPVTDIITITGLNGELFNLSVYDNTGKSVPNMKYKLVGDKLDISELINGIYFLEFSFENNRVTEKVIKM